MKILAVVICINLVLSGFMMICQLVAQVDSLFRSSFMRGVISSRGLWEYMRDVSSANSRASADTTDGRSLIYNKNKTGPNMDPWGTPAST